MSKERPSLELKRIDHADSMDSRIPSWYAKIATSPSTTIVLNDS